jgi:hypothetical protein
VEYKGWEALGSEVSELGLWDDDAQPLPTNVMYPGDDDDARCLWLAGLCKLFCKLLIICRTLIC